MDGKRSGARLNMDGFLQDNTLENFEEIKKDLNSLSKEEQMDAVYRYVAVTYCMIILMLDTIICFTSQFHLHTFLLRYLFFLVSDVLKF